MPEPKGLLSAKRMGGAGNVVTSKLNAGGSLAWKGKGGGGAKPYPKTKASHQMGQYRGGRGKR